jgi:proline iminopeptidase
MNRTNKELDAYRRRADSNDSSALLNDSPAFSTAPSERIAAGQSDLLNPSGVNLAGIRMVPVAGGKYKVWTKRIGSGRLKVLLLHGGPGFTHDYLECMEAFLSQAGRFTTKCRARAKWK